MMRDVLAVRWMAMAVVPVVMMVRMVTIAMLFMVVGWNVLTVATVMAMMM